MSKQSVCVCVCGVCVKFTFVKINDDVNVCATCLCSVIFITGCTQHMNVQPQIGGVLGGGGGEATQYFIVCEHKPLFWLFFLLYSLRISSLPTASLYFGTARFKQKNLQIICHLCPTLSVVATTQ